MFGVTPMIYSNNRHEQTQTVFGGYDHRVAAPDGTMYDSWNMCADRYPALTTRAVRGTGQNIKKPNGLYVRGCVAWVDGDRLVIDGENVATLTDGRKLIVGIQKKLCIWPDKVIFDRETGELTQMEAQWTGEAAFGDGTYAGEPALANTMTVAGDLTGLFRAGDGVVVQIVEGELCGEPMGAYVIREIEYDKDIDKTELRFYEETWRKFVAEAETGTPGEGSEHTVCIRRRVPDLDLVYEHDNRLWGTEGNTIRCCALGDPTNWEVFDGISTDAWELKLGSPEEITGGCAYGGRPMFFKERLIITVYGDAPTAYSLSLVEDLGVEKGSGGSLAVAAQTLFYKSLAGVVAYSGGYPRSIAEAFGDTKYREAAAGSDGVRYYISMADYEGNEATFVYDTRYGVWNKEDGRYIAFGWNGELVAVSRIGEVRILGSFRREVAEDEGIHSMVEFGDFADGTTRKKGLGKVILRLELEGHTTLDIAVRYDSQGPWHTVRRISGAMTKGQVEVPLMIRRCDHYRIRITGNGTGGSGWTLFALTRDRYTGSNRK